MRITIVQGPYFPVPPLNGGAIEKVWFGLGKEFASRGHQVTHISRQDERLPNREVIDGVVHVRVPSFNRPKRMVGTVFLDLLYTLQVLPKLPAADILVTNTYWLPVLERRKSRGELYIHVARFPKGQMKLYSRGILQAVSEPVRQGIVAECPEFESRTRMIPNALANEYLRLPLQPMKKVALYAGRLHPEKGVHVLVSAFAKLVADGLKEWRLKIVGPWERKAGGGGQEYFESLQAIALRCDGRIEFTGSFFKEKDLIEQYQSASVFVYPSLAEKGESFGLAVLEAMAAGCVPLTSDLPCFSDFMEPGRNGVFFDHRGPESAESLANSLRKLLECPSDIDGFRREAQKTADTYSLSSVARLYLGDFEAIKTGMRV